AQPASAARAEELLASPIALVVVLGAVALLPFAFMTLTAFVKISTVLQIVRGAIGAQNVPSNLVVMALAGALTVLAMAPVAGRTAERAEPLFAPGAQRGTSAWALGFVGAARDPLRRFLDANASQRERGRFYEMARSTRPAEMRDAVARDDLVVLVPAFVVTELLEAFAPGFALDRKTVV